MGAKDAWCMSAQGEGVEEMKAEGVETEQNTLEVQERLVSEDPEAALELEEGYGQLDGLHSRSLERPSTSTTSSSLCCVRWYSGLKAWRDPRSGKGIPRRPVCLAFFLFIIGVIFVPVFFGSWITSSFSESYPYLLVSGITLPPGTYALTVAYKSYHFEPGWSFSQIRGPND